MSQSDAGLDRFDRLLGERRPVRACFFYSSGHCLKDTIYCGNAMELNRSHHRDITQVPSSQSHLDARLASYIFLSFAATGGYIRSIWVSVYTTPRRRCRL